MLESTPKTATVAKEFLIQRLARSTSRLSSASSSKLYPVASDTIPYRASAVEKSAIA